MTDVDLNHTSEIQFRPEETTCRTSQESRTIKPLSGEILTMAKADAGSRVIGYRSRTTMRFIVLTSSEDSSHWQVIAENTVPHPDTFSRNSSIPTENDPLSRAFGGLIRAEADPFHFTDNVHVSSNEYNQRWGHTCYSGQGATQ